MKKIVEVSDEGFCKVCNCAFHWGRCGEWHDTDEGRDHCCNNCASEGGGK